MKTGKPTRNSTLSLERLESRRLLTAGNLELALVSTGTPGEPAAQIGNDSSVRPAISADGRYVAFNSAADNLVAGDANGATDVFVKDMWTGELRLVSTARDGTQGDLSASSSSRASTGSRLT